MNKSVPVHFLTAWQRASQVVHKREEFALPMQFYLCRRFGLMQPFPIVHRISQDTHKDNTVRVEDHGSPSPATRSGQQARRMILKSTASPYPCIARVLLITMVFRSSLRSTPVMISALCGAAAPLEAIRKRCADAH